MIATLIRCGDSFLSRKRLALSLMVNPASWFAFKALIGVGTVPDLPILNSKVLSMSSPLLSFGCMKEGTLVYWTVVGYSARLLLATYASLLFASLFAALRVPAMPYAVFVGFVCGIALVGPCPLLARFQSFGFILLHLMMIGQALPQCFLLEISCTIEMMGCFCGAASMMVTAAALSYLYMQLRMQAAAAGAAAFKGVHMFVILLAPAAVAFAGMLAQKMMHAAAATAAANIEKNVPASLFVVDGDFTSALLLASAALASVDINIEEEVACSCCVGSRAR